MSLSNRPFTIRAQKLVLTSLFFGMLCFSPRDSAPQAQAPDQKSTAKNIKAVPLADRLSFIMRGIPAAPEERDSIAKNQATLVELAEKYRNHKQFEKRLAQHWNRVFKTKSVDIRSVVGLQKFMGSVPRTTDDFNPGTFSLWFDPATNTHVPVAPPAKVPPAVAPASLPVRSLPANLLKIQFNKPTGGTHYYSLIGPNSYTLPQICPGYNPRTLRGNLDCLANPFTPTNTLKPECAEFADPTQYFCADTARVDLRPNWPTWPTELVDGKTLPKAIKVCPGVKKNCSPETLPVGTTPRVMCLQNKYSNNTYDVSYMLQSDKYKALCESFVTMRAQYGSTCAGDNLAQTNPWWNMSATVNVCKAMLDQKFCGANLERCVPTEPIFGETGVIDPNFDMNLNLVNGLTSEPGLIAARTIIEDKPWDTVATGKESLSNGALEHFLTKYAPVFRQRPSTLELNSPPLTYSDASGKSKFETPRSPADTNNKWFYRGESHAGIFTTLAFMTTFNGTRAKANAAYEGLLCKKFVLPAGLKPQPDSETDLTKKAVCSECHRTLEPMAQFFSRWQHKENMFGYNPEIPASGEFRTVAGSDVPAFAASLVAQPEFPACAVARMVEFYAGRPMNAKEYESLLPVLVQKFETAKRKLWAIVPDILASSAFLGDK